MGNSGKRLSSYSGEFKLNAVNDVLTNHLGLRETARKHGVTHKMVQTWIKLFIERGPEYFTKIKAIALVNDKDPTIESSNVKSVTRKPMKKISNPSTNSQLLAELKTLKMENAYLKKLNALARSKEQLRIKKKHK